MMIYNIFRMTEEGNVVVVSYHWYRFVDIVYSCHDRCTNSCDIYIYIVVGFLFGCGCVCVCGKCVCVCDGRMSSTRGINGNRHIRSTRHQSDCTYVGPTYGKWLKWYS